MNIETETEIKNGSEHTFQKWRLINYFDVWNSDEGWSVNNLCVEFDDLQMSAKITNKELLTYLKSISFLSSDDENDFEIEHLGERVEISNKETFEPICALELVY